MKNFLNKYKKYLILFLSLNIISILLGIIYMVSNINYNNISIILIIINQIFIFLLSYFYARNKDQKGIITGLKVGIIYSILLIILSIIFRLFSLKSLIYYLIIILSSIFGSIISKNKK